MNDTKVQLTTADLAKYSKVPLTFYSYYKYSFTFIGHLPDGRTLKASVGGGADDIYKLNVEEGTPWFIGDSPEDSWNFIWIESSGNTVAEWGGRYF